MHYRKRGRLRFTSHLDVLRALERAVRRAGLPLAYSEGFTPHPKLAFAAPLPLGFEGEREIVDMTLVEPVDIGSLVDRLASQSSEDLKPFEAFEVALRAPSPQATTRWAEYRVDLPEIEISVAEPAIEQLLAAEELEWTETRQEKQRTYDLRALIVWLRAARTPNEHGTRLTMRLSAGNEANGRPEQVVAALFPETKGRDYARTTIILDEPSPAREAWRKIGRYS